MEDDQGTEDLFGEDWRSKVQAKGGRQYEDPLAVSLERSRERGRGREATAPETIPPLGWRDILWRVLEGILADRILYTSGGVAFFTLLAFFPAVATIVSLYGLVTDVSTIREHLTLLESILPDGAIKLIGDQMAHIAGQRGTLSSVFFIVALWSANSGVAALFDAFNVIYKEKERRSLLRLYGTTFLFTFGWIAFMLAAIGAVIVVPLVLTFMGMSTPAERLLSIVRWPVLLIVVILGLAALYRYGPSRQSAKWRWVTWGSTVAAVLWILTSMLFSWYVSFESYNRLYGSLGTAIGFMVWIWLSVVVILIGAELNAEMEHQTARDTTEGVEKPLGMRGAVVADRVGPAQVDLKYAASPDRWRAKLMNTSENDLDAGFRGQ